RIPAATPFQTPDWLLTWWSHFGSGQPRVFVFRDKGEIAGVMPCFLHDWNGRKQLTLMGTGISDYLDPAVDPSRHSAIIGTLAGHPQPHRDWDLCDWQDLSADTPLAALGHVHPDTPCTELALPVCFETLSLQLQRNLRHCREKAGGVEFAITPRADAELLAS